MGCPDTGSMSPICVPQPVTSPLSCWVTLKQAPEIMGGSGRYETDTSVACEATGSAAEEHTHSSVMSGSRVPAQHPSLVHALEAVFHHVHASPYVLSVVALMGVTK